MEELQINYIGEWLRTGQLGHLLTIVSLVSALLATASFYIATTQEDQQLDLANSWKRIGRVSFGISGLCVIGIFCVLFYLIFNHRFEYKYVWQHSSLELPVYYMISCFWEGQEGSFLLWSFWTVVLGGFLMRWAGKWENSVMTFVGMMQIFLAAMLIGIYFFGYKVGSSPFLLLREDMPHLPLFKNANYANLIGDGNGLNPLLQNYWMVIHPPVLFLGFAATLIPFSYCMAGLWKRNFTDWVLPTLRWSLFTGALLGTGILMGGAWAYEALSFGGFWAWDPVENASLVPWLVLIAGIHTLLAYKHSGHSLGISLILISASLWTILYSTFLTRSGVLGDTSVHSFTDLGMSGQLLFFLLFFIALSIFLMLKNWSVVPKTEKEEHLYSREFWMFIGSLLLSVFALLITIDTSWPIFNKVFGTNRTITDPITHYNQYAVWFAIMIAILSAVVQYFRYKKDDLGRFLRKVALATVISVVLTGIIAFFGEITTIVYILILFAAIYVITANAAYIFMVLSGKIKIAGGSVAHIGVGLMLLGILFSSGKKEVISLNRLGIKFGEGFNEQDNRENVLLYKGLPIQMNEYWVTYVGDSISGPNHFYEVRYEKKKKKEDPAEEVFVLFPNAQFGKDNGLLPNPDARHYLTKDVFTYVSSVADKERTDKGIELKEIELGIGDTALVGGKFLILKNINPNPVHPMYLPLDGDIAAGAKLEIQTMDGRKYEAEPVYLIRRSEETGFDDFIDDLSLTLKFDKIYPKKGKVKLSMIQEEMTDFIIMKAIVFPYINVLWGGCLIMVIGFFMSIIQRYQEGKRKRKRKAAIE